MTLSPLTQLGSLGKRVLLWLCPLLFLGVGLILLRELHTRAVLDEVWTLLVAGDTHGAAERLQEMPAWGVMTSSQGTSSQGTSSPSASSGSIVRTVLAILEDRPASIEQAGFGNSSPPLTLIARAAFDRGDFAASLRLINLAMELGLPTNPTLAAVALIELDRNTEARTLLQTHSIPSNHLLQRAHQHLEHPALPGGRLLRDRTGRGIGILDSEGLRLFEDIPTGIVPPMIATMAKSYPESGSLRLAIDLELSEVAKNAFGPRDRGSIVLLDPHSGEILAAVSDATTLKEGGTPAFEQLREPASIAKLITIAAGLRAGLDPDAEIARMTCRGHESYGGVRLYCPTISGPLRSLDRALAVSCNVAFGNLGVLAGRSRLVEELRRFGFDRRNGNFRGGRILSPQGNVRQLADLAIGLDDLELTPLHAAQIAAVMVNRGHMPTPVLVRATDGRLGFHPQALPVAPSVPVLDKIWLPVLLQAMEAVAARGTGRKLAPWSFPVAMKTGTASHPEYGFHVNYIGVGPMPHPRLAFCVRITHQRTSRRVREAARRVTRALLKSLGDISEERGWPAS